MMSRKYLFVLITILLFLPQASQAEDYPTAFGVQFGGDISEVIDVYKEKESLQYCAFYGDIKSGDFSMVCDPLDHLDGAFAIKYSAFENKIYKVTFFFDKCEVSKPKKCDKQYKTLNKLLSKKYGQSYTVSDYKHEGLEEFESSKNLSDLIVWKTDSGLTFKLFKDKKDDYYVWMVCSCDELLEKYVKFHS